MKVLLGLLVVLVLLLVGLLSLPFLVDLSRYQEYYRPYIEEALNRKISVERIRLTIVPRLGVRLAGLTVLEDPHFGQGPFVALAAVDVGVKLRPLFSGRLEVEEIRLQQPVITVVKNRDGVLNVSTVGQPAPEAPPPATPSEPTGPLRALALLAVDEVALTGGRLMYQDRSTPKRVEYRLDELAIRMQDLRLGDMARLSATATVQPYGLPVTVDSTLGPISAQLDFETIDGIVQVGKVRLAIKGRAVGGHANLHVAAPVINAEDLPVAWPLTRPIQVTNLTIDAEADYPLPPDTQPLEAATITRMTAAVVLGQSVIAVNGTLLHGEAAVTATAPSVTTTDVPLVLPLRRPMEVKDLKAVAHLKGQQATLDQLELRLFDGRVTGTGGLTLGPGAPPFHAAAAVDGLQLGPALAAVHEGVSISGTTSGRVALKGVGLSKRDLASSLHGKGAVTVKNGRLEGLTVLEEVLSALQAVGVHVDAPKATVFSSIDGTATVEHGVMTVDRLAIDSRDFQGSVHGTVTFDQVLNLKGTLTLSEALSKQIVASAPAVRLAFTGNRLSVPMVVTGTARAPIYRVDTKAVSGKVQERVKEQVKDTVDDLLKGKKIDLEKGLKRLFGE